MCNKIKSLIFLALMLVTCGLFSCKSWQDEAITENNQGQLFRPSNFTGSVSGTNMSFSWYPVGGANYELELSTDIAFGSNNLKIDIPNRSEIEGTTTIATTRSWRVSNLISNTGYYARIRSVSVNNSMETSGWTVYCNASTLVPNRLTTSNENVFYTMPSEAIGIDFIQVRWDSTLLVNRITIAQTDADPVSFTLTEQELKSGSKEFTGLLGNTTYNFELFGILYDGNTYRRGVLSVTTKTENIFNPVADDDTGLDFIKLSWDNTTPADKIIVAAEDGTEITVSITAAESEKEITGLSPETTYTVSIYTGNVLRGTEVARTKTDYSYNIFLDPEVEDIDQTQITLKWNDDAFDVTHIQVSRTGTADVRVNLSSDDVAAHAKAVTGLISNTSYTFRIYNGSNLRGELVVTTL